MRTLVLGGGYAGLLLARKLESALPPDVELQLVDETGEHLVQHELHRVVRKPGFADAITIPLPEVLDRTRVTVGTVTELDREGRALEVRTDDGRERLEYDVVAVCLGARTAFYDIPGLEDRATPLKRVEHARQVRREFESIVDRGEGTVVVGGAGLSGVQVAGELAAFAGEENVADTVDVVLVEQAPAVAPRFGDEFGKAIERKLEDLGVEIRTGTEVTGAGPDAVELEDGELAADQLVWTGGIRGPDVLGGERPVVRDTLALDERTFVLGDAARIVDADGEAVPAAAQSAVRATPTAARNLARTVAELRGERLDTGPDRWRFESPGWLVSVGDGAVAKLGARVVTGPAAEAIKSAMGVTYVAEHGTLRNALSVLREELGADDEDDLLRALRRRRPE